MVAKPKPEPVKKKVVSTTVTNASPKVSKTDQVDIVGKTITKTPITNNGMTLMYIKVEYTWGGKFFFIEDEPNQYRNISQQYYIE
ncbi:MAG: hypothetical protein PF517_12005 [Salinivirgaceae bacterium]|jgi:hypothetical protein|nr:hypothetical protein [Salinivirgaceae bacterium]